MGNSSHPLKLLPEDWQEKILKEYKEGASDVEIRADLNLTWAGWKQLMDDSPEFYNTVVIGRQLEKAWWMRVGRVNVFDRNFNSMLWYRNMQNRFGWSDKQTSNVNGPVAGEEDMYDDSSASDYLSDLIKEASSLKIQ